jgi:hypothetical protein
LNAIDNTIEHIHAHVEKLWHEACDLNGSRYPLQAQVHDVFPTCAFSFTHEINVTKHLCPRRQLEEHFAVCAAARGPLSKTDAHPVHEAPIAELEDRNNILACQLETTRSILRKLQKKGLCALHRSHCSAQNLGRLVLALNFSRIWGAQRTSQSVKSALMCLKDDPQASKKAGEIISRSVYARHLPDSNISFSRVALKKSEEALSTCA